MLVHWRELLRKYSILSASQTHPQICQFLHQCTGLISGSIAAIFVVPRAAEHSLTECPWRWSSVDTAAVNNLSALERTLLRSNMLL